MKKIEKTTINNDWRKEQKWKRNKKGRRIQGKKKQERKITKGQKRKNDKETWMKNYNQKRK